jgi:hypothetical protein
MCCCDLGSPISFSALECTGNARRVMVITGGSAVLTEESAGAKRVHW